MAVTAHANHVLSDEEQILVTIETDAAFSPDLATDLCNRARTLLRETTADILALQAAAEDTP